MHQAVFNEEPFADSFIVNRKSLGITKFLGFFIRLTFVATVVIAGVYYQLQQPEQQLLVDLPIVNAKICLPLGTPGIQSLVNSDNSIITTINLQFWGSRIPIQYATVDACNVWINNTIQYNMNGFQNINELDFNLDPYKVFPTPAQQAQYLADVQSTDFVDLRKLVVSIGSAISPTCKDYYSTEIWNQAESYCRNITGSFDVKNMVLGASNITSNLYSVNYDCYLNYGGDITIHTGSPFNVLYVGPCSSSYITAKFVPQIQAFCAQFPSLNGPYLCTVTTARSIADIINLAFAAGGSAALILTVFLKVVHGTINPTVGDPTKSFPMTSP